MEEKFDELLNNLFESFDANGDKDVNAFLAEKVKKMNLSADSTELLNQTNEWIDAFDENARSLKEAKDKGKTRRSWLKSKLDTALADRTEKEKVEFANAILKANDEIIDTTLNEE